MQQPIALKLLSGHRSSGAAADCTLAAAPEPVSLPHALQATTASPPPSEVKPGEALGLSERDSMGPLREFEYLSSRIFHHARGTRRAPPPLSLASAALGPFQLDPKQPT